MEDFRLAERMTLDTGARELGETINTMMGSELGGPEVVSELVWQVSSILRPRVESTDPILADAVSFQKIPLGGKFLNSLCISVAIHMLILFI